MVITREQLIEHRKAEAGKKGKVRVDFNEVIIVCFALAILGGGLYTNRLSEAEFGTLAGSFFGYTFGRIFNHVQGKE